MVRIKNKILSVILATVDSFVSGISTTMQLLGQENITLVVVRLTNPLRYKK